MTLRTFVIGTALALCAAAPAPAQVPPAGLVAEGEGRWSDALQIYRADLAADPSRGDLWMRVADIEAAHGRRDAAMEALRHAQRCYRELEQRQPAAAGATLNLARASAWSGDTDAAAGAYRRELRQRPGNADAWLELARVESWRGNTAGALDALDSYQARFGRSRQYTVTRAQILAAGGRPGAALDLVNPMYREQPADYDLAYTRSLALTMERRMPDAFDALTALRQLGANRRETKDAEQMYRTFLGSTAAPGLSFYSDSDHIEITRVSPSATAMLRTGTQLFAGYERDLLRAPQANGLGRSSGASIDVRQFLAGAAQPIGPLTVLGRIGRATAGDYDHTPYVVAMRLRAADAFSASFEVADEFFVVSPRTVELGLTQVRYRTELGWSPSIQSFVALTAQYQDLSDGNERFEMTVTPRVGVARTRRANLDVGVSGSYLSATRDLPNGYYDPGRYESYSGVLYPYFKFSENVGLGFSAALGTQRQEHRPFRFGGSLIAEGSIGIYQAWLLQMSAGVTHNQRLATGAFDGYTGSVVLVRRF